MLCVLSKLTLYLNDFRSQFLRIYSIFSVQIFSTLNFSKYVIVIVIFSRSSVASDELEDNLSEESTDSEASDSEEEPPTDKVKDDEEDSEEDLPADLNKFKNVKIESPMPTTERKFSYQRDSKGDPIESSANSRTRARSFTVDCGSVGTGIDASAAEDDSLSSPRPVRQCEQSPCDEASQLGRPISVLRR